MISIGTAELANVTVSGNMSRAAFDSFGGGIWAGNTTQLTNVTLTNNQVVSLGDGSPSVGGGISGSANVVNTLIAGNTATIGPDCSAALTSAGHNLIQDPEGCSITGAVTGNVLGVDPQLGSLQDNGGATLTHALLPGSPAIDAGTNDACPATDQRGVTRPQDGNGDTTAICDIGAYERAALGLIVTLDIKPGSATNQINLKAHGVIPVAVLTTTGFDASTIDVLTVCFGDADAPAERDCMETHGRGHLQDVDGDGDQDLLLHFEIQQTGIDAGDIQACLTGRIVDGQTIQGCDSVRVRA
jgi:hypothetical protein